MPATTMPFLPSPALPPWPPQVVLVLTLALMLICLSLGVRDLFQAFDETNENRDRDPHRR